MMAASYLISFSNTNFQCFNTTSFNAIAGSETQYTLTDLHEGTEYIISVTALIGGRNVKENLTATTIASGW